MKIKNNKTTNAVIFIILLNVFLLLPLTAYAAYEVYYVEDLADLLSADEWRELETRAEEISEKYRCEVRIFTVKDMWDYGYDDIEAFAYTIYAELGPLDRDCVLLTLSMAGGSGNRDFDFQVWGDWANTAFTLSGIDSILDNHIYPHLRNENYYRAFTAFFDRAEYYFDRAESGSPFVESGSSSYEDSESVPVLYKLIFILIASVLHAFIICSVWRSNMKTAKIARTACNYIPEDGFKLTGQGDIFMYRKVSRTKIVKSSSSGSSGGRASGGGRGGSSGRSGKF